MSQIPSTEILSRKISSSCFEYRDVFFIGVLLVLSLTADTIICAADGRDCLIKKASTLFVLCMHVYGMFLDTLNSLTSM